VLQNQVRDHTQNRNPKQTNHGAQDHSPIRPSVSDDAGPQDDHGTPDHGDRRADRTQQGYVANPAAQKQCLLDLVAHQLAGHMKQQLSVALPRAAEHPTQVG
jgi:hypothetical protein